MTATKILWGQNPHRLRHRAHHDLERDAVDRMAARISGAAWHAMVRSGGAVGLSATCFLLVVVLL